MLDFRVFSYSAYTLLTDRYVGAGSAEIEHLLNGSSIRNPGHFVFANTSEKRTYSDTHFFHHDNIEVFAKTK